MRLTSKSTLYVVTVTWSVWSINRSVSRENRPWASMTSDFALKCMACETSAPNPHYALLQIQPETQQGITAAQSAWKIASQSRNEAVSILKTLGGQIPSGEIHMEANGITNESELYLSNTTETAFGKMLTTRSQTDYIST